MAVPKRKMSRANTRARRSQWKATAATLSTCPQCKGNKLNHQACPTCGAYKGRVYGDAMQAKHAN